MAARGAESAVTADWHWFVERVEQGACASRRRSDSTCQAVVFEKLYPIIFAVAALGRAPPQTP